jgi:hypothetical protein
VKTKEKVPESILMGVPPQRQQQDINDSDPGHVDSAHHEAEDDEVEDVQHDAHSGPGGEDPPQQQEYDNVEENDHDQQEAPGQDSAPSDPLRRSSRGRVPSIRYASNQCVVLLSDGSEPGVFQRQ